MHQDHRNNYGSIQIPSYMKQYANAVLDFHSSPNTPITFTHDIISNYDQKTKIKALEDQIQLLKNEITNLKSLTVL